MNYPDAGQQAGLNLRFSHTLSFEPMSRKRYNLACALNEDLDQPAHTRSLIRVFDVRSMDSQGFNIYSGGKLRL